MSSTDKSSPPAYPSELTDDVRAPPGDPDTPTPTPTPDGASTTLDVAFLCDCTSSMGSHIAAAKAAIRDIIHKLHCNTDASTVRRRDARFALVGYRDHPPQDRTFVTQVYDFTSDVNRAEANVGQLQPHGGGDGPESFVDALDDAARLNWRDEAIKLIVSVSDAPPHGVEASGDGFPTGCPKKLDDLVLARELAERGIVLYVAGVEPNISSYAFAKDFYKALASITGGRYVALGNAQILPDIILGGVEEETDYQELRAKIDAEVKKVRAEKPDVDDEEAIADEAAKRLAKQGVKMATLQVDKVEAEDEVTDLSNEIADCDTMKEMRKMLRAKHPNKKPTSSGYAFGGGGAYGRAPPTSSSSFAGFAYGGGGAGGGASSAPGAPAPAPSAAAAPSFDYASQSAGYGAVPVNSVHVMRHMRR